MLVKSWRQHAAARLPLVPSRRQQPWFQPWQEELVELTFADISLRLVNVLSRLGVHWNDHLPRAKHGNCKRLVGVVSFVLFVHICNCIPKRDWIRGKTKRMAKDGIVVDNVARYKLHIV